MGSEFFACKPDLECFLKIGTFQFVMNIIRYYPIAGLAFLVFWVWKKNYFQRFRIQEAFPKIEKVLFEIKQSGVTLFTFTCIAMLSIFGKKFGFWPNQIYFKFEEYSTAYAIFSFLLLTVFHETYFYWAHRLMHTKKLYTLIHSVHHKSVNPSPLAAYNFHITEAFCEAIYLPIFVTFIPMHFQVLLFHTFYAMILNIYFHLGYEFYPKGFATHPIFKWFNTATHHNLHHQKFHGNYGLYFNFWDRIMGTNFQNYSDYYETVVSKRAIPLKEKVKA